MARNRYGWQKRAKELARKQKHDDKIKRRQGKIAPPSEETISEVSEVSEVSEENLAGLSETGPMEADLPAGAPRPE